MGSIEQQAGRRDTTGGEGSDQSSEGGAQLLSDPNQEREVSHVQKGRLAGR